MTACLAPNGQNVFRGGGPCTRVLVGTRDGMSVLERAPGGSWTTGGMQLPGSHISCAMYESKHRGFFAGVHGGGVYFSADEGRTWQPRSRGITFQHAFTLGYAEPPYGVVLYAGTEPAALFKSHDYGQTWEELPAVRAVPGTDKWTFPPPPHVAHAKTLAVDPRNQEVMYLGVEQGALLKSTDAGASWRELDGYSKPDDDVYRDIHRVLLRPSNPDEIFMTGGMGLYHSADAGETWEHLTGRDFRIGYPDQLFFSPVDDSILIMAGSAKNPGAWRQSHDADSTIMRSADLGKTWAPLGTGLPAHIRGNMEAMSMYVWQDGPKLTFGLLAGTTDGDVFYSENEGQSWERIASGLPPVSKGGHYRNLVGAAA